jgi:hypothetical protein
MTRQLGEVSASSPHNFLKEVEGNCITLSISFNSMQLCTVVLITKHMYTQMQRALFLTFHIHGTVLLAHLFSSLSDSVSSLSFSRILFTTLSDK